MNEDDTLDTDIEAAIEAFFEDQDGSNVEALRRQLATLGLRIVRDASGGDLKLDFSQLEQAK